MDSVLNGYLIDVYTRYRSAVDPPGQFRAAQVKSGVNLVDRATGYGGYVGREVGVVRGVRWVVGGVNE